MSCKQGNETSTLHTLMPRIIKLALQTARDEHLRKHRHQLDLPEHLLISSRKEVSIRVCSFFAQGEEPFQKSCSRLARGWRGREDDGSLLDSVARLLPLQEHDTLFTGL